MSKDRKRDRERSEAKPSSRVEGERFAEWKGLWGKVKGFIFDVVAYLEEGGRMVIDGLDLGREIGAYFARRIRLTIALGATIGISSPVTHGWGIQALGESGWLIWSPVAGVPAVIALVALTISSLRHLDREARRSFRRRAAEQPDPHTERELALEAERREVVTEELEKNEPTVPLEEQDFVPDDLRELYFKVNRASNAGDLKIGLMGWTGNHLAMVAKRGEIPSSLRDQLTLGWNDLTGIREALDDALEPLRYRHYVVPFSAGMYSHYVLIGLSGATIPPHVRLEISRTATRLLGHHAYGLSLPSWATGEA